MAYLVNGTNSTTKTPLPVLYDSRGSLRFMERHTLLQQIMRHEPIDGSLNRPQT